MVQPTDLTRWVAGVLACAVIGCAATGCHRGHTGQQGHATGPGASAQSSRPSDAASASTPASSTPSATSTPALDRAGLQRAIDGLLRARPIGFEPDSATLTPGATETVLAIARVLQNATDARVEVDGYAAKVEGVYPHTQTLSTQRANRVRVLLATHGVDRSRIVVRGLGDVHPIASNTTPEGQAQNRRVTVRVL